VYFNHFISYETINGRYPFRLRTRQERKTFLFREVISSSKVERISCAPHVLPRESYGPEKSINLRVHPGIVSSKRIRLRFMLRF
jgi:hypothetical protein